MFMKSNPRYPKFQLTSFVMAHYSAPKFELASFGVLHFSLLYKNHYNDKTNSYAYKFDFQISKNAREITKSFWRSKESSCLSAENNFRGDSKSFLFLKVLVLTFLQTVYFFKSCPSKFKQQSNHLK